MGEVAYMDEGDLEAIVRGGGYSGSGENSGGFSTPVCFPSETVSFYEPEMEITGLDELGELYKPFYPFSTQTILTTSVSIPEDSRSFCDDRRQRSHGSVLSSGSRVDIRVRESKSKKSKKNQQKRVVEQVKEENLLSDVWAWRKYGQKPIKGSPYPRSLTNPGSIQTKHNRFTKFSNFVSIFRSYYRCSSSKGCLARKQVERNPQNQEKFTITYTNEHNHDLPTRRNSLAGSTRAKSSQTKPVLTTKPGKQIVSSSTSNHVIDESLNVVQDLGVADMNTYQISSGLKSDLMSGNEDFTSFAGDMDELLRNQELYMDGYLWNY